MVGLADLVVMGVRSFGSIRFNDINGYSNGK